MAREVWEMAEETNNDENEFTSTKRNCKFKTMSSMKNFFLTRLTAVIYRIKINLKNEKNVPYLILNSFLALLPT